MSTGTQVAQIKYPMEWRGGRLLGPTLIYINEDGIPIELRLNDEQVQVIVDDWNARDILDSEIGEEVDRLRPPIAV